MASWGTVKAVLERSPPRIPPKNGWLKSAPSTLMLALMPRCPESEICPRCVSIWSAGGRVPTLWLRREEQGNRVESLGVGGHAPAEAGGGVGDRHVHRRQHPALRVHGPAGDLPGRGLGLRETGDGSQGPDQGQGGQARSFLHVHSPVGRGFSSAIVPPLSSPVKRLASRSRFELSAGADIIGLPPEAKQSGIHARGASGGPGGCAPSTRQLNDDEVFREGAGDPPS